LLTFFTLCKVLWTYKIKDVNYNFLENGGKVKKNIYIWVNLLGT
jgi:hypothetical protein